MAPPASGATASSLNTMHEARAPMKNASRERRKAERVALAAQVQALERELVARRANDSAMQAWRARASDEIRKRRLAECTNHQLREALKRQETTLATLVRKLNVPYEEEEETTTPCVAVRVAVRVAVPSRCLHDDHGRRFAMLLEEVDRACHEDLDLIFDTRVKVAHDATSAAATFTPRLVRHPNPRNGELVLEARRATRVAWELHRCCEALWTANEQVARATHAGAWVSRPREDVVMMRLRASSQHDDGDGDAAWRATSSLVEKRFWLGDRMAVVWRAVTSIDNHAELADVYVEETGWTLVQDARRAEDDLEEKHEGGDDEEEDGVELWDCVHTVPRSTRLDDPAEPEPEEDGGKGKTSGGFSEHVKHFTRHVMDATTAHLDAIRDRMENLLIEDCMRDVE